LGKHHKINKEKSIQILEKQDFDVFHPTYYDDYFLKFLKNKPFVLTVHDLTHQIFPEYFSPKWIDKSQLMLDEAKRIIVVSENTKKDLIEYYNVDQEKVDVVHLASSILTGTQQNGLVINTESRKKYLLYIGSRASYKNFYFFVQALIPLFNADKELFLMCTGEEFTEEEFFFLSKLGIANKVKHVFVTEKNLAEVYLNSIAFVFPSLYEGFGMPILEAFACGCPVICSDSSSFPEIAGEAAIYFEPKSKQSIYQSISNLLNDDDLRKNMIIKGFKQLEKFSWLKTVAQTRDVYLKAISK
jgi:glycosyltransferase involved in cell wall biosynthesis